MKIRVKSIEFGELPIYSHGSKSPIGFTAIKSRIVFEIYLDSGDTIEYTLRVDNNNLFMDSIDALKHEALHRIRNICDG